MSDSVRQLRALCLDPPSDLVEHFSNLTKARSKATGLLMLPTAVELSTKFREFHPLAEPLGLIFLDESSDYHCLISRGPLTGCVLYLCHDGDPFAVFDSLQAYFDAVSRAEREDANVTDFHPPRSVLGPDQNGLAKEVERLSIDEEDEGAVAQLVVLIPALDLSQRSLADGLAHHSNFFVGESLGNAIAARPRRSLMKAAMTLSNHAHSQAANAGKRAVAAINQNW
jgi:hypothetical protein